MSSEGFLGSNLQKCSKCGTVMKFMGGGAYKCPHCLITEYDDYGKVRNFLYNRKAGASNSDDIIQETGVSIENILGMIRDEKFSLAGDSKFKLRCQGCGTTILMGTHCNKCKSRGAVGFKRSSDNERIRSKGMGR